MNFEYTPINERQARCTFWEWDVITHYSGGKPVSQKPIFVQRTLTCSLADARATAALMAELSTN